MTLDVDTKDCTALADGELAEMADTVTDGPAGFDIGLLSKQAEEWVLITQIRDVGKLVGFSFCTLERIGGEVIRDHNIGSTRIMDVDHQQHWRVLRAVVNEFVADPDLHPRPSHSKPPVMGQRRAGKNRPGPVAIPTPPLAIGESGDVTGAVCHVRVWP